MKKILALLLVICVLAAGVYVYVEVTQKPVVVEEILPAGPLVYVSGSDMQTIMEKFRQTKFWQGVRAIDYKKALEALDAPQEVSAFYEDFEKRFSSPEVIEVFNKFLGKEVAMAFYPFNLQDIRLDNLDEVFKNVFFVTRVGKEVQFAELFSGVFSYVNKDISVHDVPFKKHTIHVITTNDGTVSIGYVRIKDLLIFGVGDLAARRCLEVLDKTKPALSGDEHYLRAGSSATEGADIFGYINFDLFVKAAKAKILEFAAQEQADSELVKKQLEENFKQMEGFREIGVSVLFDRVSKKKIDLHFSKAELHPDIQPLYACQSQENKTLQFTTKEALVYQWSACYDLDYYWEQVKKQLQQVSQEAGGGPDIIMGMEEALGLSVEKDILPALGDEIGGYLAGFDFQGFFPIPEIVFIIEAKEKQKASHIVDTLIGQLPFMRQETETYQGATIKYTTIPLSPNFQPAYSFINGYLVVTTNRNRLKEAMDVSRDSSKSLSANVNFQKINFGLTQRSNATFFVDVERSVDLAEKLLDWSDQWASTRFAQQAAFKKGSMQRLVDVLADIDEREASIVKLKEEIKDKKIEKKSVELDPDQIEGIVAMIVKKDKFIETVENRLKPFKEEEARLVTIDKDETKVLAQESRQRLADIRKIMERMEPKLNSLKRDREEFIQQKRALDTKAQQVNAMDEQIAELEREAFIAEESLGQEREKKKELEAIIRDYEEAQKLTPEAQSVLLNDFAKPLLKAIRALKGLASRVVFGDEILETFIYWEME